MFSYKLVTDGKSSLYQNEKFNIKIEGENSKQGNSLDLKKKKIKEHIQFEK